MANKQIAALPDVVSPLDGSEFLPISQAGVTGRVTVAALAALIHDAENDPGAGGTLDYVTAPAVDLQVIVIGMSAPYATFTVKLPGTPRDGQRFYCSFSDTVTALTVSAQAGDTVSGAPTTSGVTTPFGFMYDLSTHRWYRI